MSDLLDDITRQTVRDVAEDLYLPTPRQEYGPVMSRVLHETYEPFIPPPPPAPQPTLPPPPAPLGGKTATDLVNHPPHYQGKGIEAIQVIEAFDLGYHLGNVIKYVLRSSNKGGVEDLKKARWYLDRYIQQA